MADNPATGEPARSDPDAGAPAGWTPGSFLVLCHAAEAGPIMAQPLEKVYNQSVSGSLRIRSGPEILPFFEGFKLLDPGLVSGPGRKP
jgi:hypothetical protein